MNPLIPTADPVGYVPPPRPEPAPWWEFTRAKRNWAEGRGPDPYANPVTGAMEAAGWNPMLAQAYGYVPDTALALLQEAGGLMAGAGGALADITAPLQGEGNADRLARDLGAMAVEVPWVETMSMQIPELAHVAKGVKNAGRAVKDRLAHPGPVPVMGVNFGSKGKTVGKLTDTPGVPAVRGAADAVPPKLAVRGPSGGSARAVGGGKYSQGYDTAAGSGPDTLSLLNPTDAGRAAYGDAMRSFEEVSDFETFNKYQKAAQESHGALGRSVDVYSPQYLKENGYRAFMTPDGSASFAISPQGEVASVVTHKGKADPRAVNAILPLATQEGATWLQAFDTTLPQLYGEHGFRPVARIPFAPDVAVADWGAEGLEAFQDATAPYKGGNPDLAFMTYDPSFTGRNLPDTGGIRAADWDSAQAALDTETARMATRRTPTDAAYVAPRATGQADGSLGLLPDQQIDVTWDGKQPADWTPQDWHDFGTAHDVPNLGPADEKAWQANLRTYDTERGPITIPGGDEPFTYYDMLHIKSQGIDPNAIPAELHDQIHRRMVAGVSAGDLSDEGVVNGLLMGMASPNNPLLPNEMAMQAMMVKGPQDLRMWGDMGGFDYRKGTPPQAERRKISNQITARLGINAEDAGGLGVSGNANYADFSEMTQKAADRPDFYRFSTREQQPAWNPDVPYSDSEKWGQFVTEVMNETRGLGTKTGAFGTVWQDPQNAAISAIDRHMVTLFQDEMFPTTAARDAWRNKVVKAYNKIAPEKNRKAVSGWKEFEKAPGARGVFVDQAMAHVNATPTVKVRNKAGDFNPRVPDLLRSTDWVGGEPEVLELTGDAMLRSLAANDALAKADNIGLFSSQWKEWDKIRQRVEPHEIMFRGLEKLPRMSQKQMREVLARYVDAGYSKSPKQVNQITNPSSIGYFGIGGASMLPLLQQREDDRHPLLRGGS